MPAVPPHHSPMTRLLHAGLVIALLTASGCKGASNLPLAPQVPNSRSSLFSIEIEADAKAVAAGSTLPLAVNGLDDKGVKIDVTATWKSSDASVAKVDASGTVTGVKKGTATITATTKTPSREATLTINVLTAGSIVPGTNTGSLDGADDPFGGTGRLPIGVTGPSDTALAIYPTVPRVAPGEKVRLVALQGPTGGQTPAAAVWRTADANVATVDEAGVVTALQAGNVTISASSVTYPGLVQQVQLSVIAPAAPAAISGIRIKPSRVSVGVGETFFLDAEVPTWTGGFDPLVRWESGDPTIVSVSENGQLTGLMPGNTTITAISAGYTSGDLSAIIPVEVRNSSFSASPGY